MGAVVPLSYCFKFHRLYVSNKYWELQFMQDSGDHSSACYPALSLHLDGMCSFTLSRPRSCRRCLSVAGWAATLGGGTPINIAHHFLPALPLISVADHPRSRMLGTPSWNVQSCIFPVDSWLRGGKKYENVRECSQRTRMERRCGVHCSAEMVMSQLTGFYGPDRLLPAADPPLHSSC
ncbi:uncharacterized protein EI90DRAFT_1189088 [Cantharellus anzutake]|uniref:uncharacterized protein n=1 Tax=Cantharellus anzutake TaxID=1750568 RepID=UPI0019089CC5|nr:uncharacterized protein EI90DRAFT_1189088 [Cantharellus anzutake]KAF8330409.1 hypothetical protein EI90DRAFT_1189088 [Cantharellus anzutake]